MSPTTIYRFLMPFLTIIPIIFPSAYPTIITNIIRAINFDNAATTPPFKSVIDKIQNDLKEIKEHLKKHDDQIDDSK